MLVWIYLYNRLQKHENTLYSTDNNKCVYEVFEGGMFLFKFVYTYGFEYSCADLKWHAHNIKL